MPHNINMLCGNTRTFGGEGWPAADVAKPFKFRKSRSVRLAGSCRFERERVRNLQKNRHTTDTAAFGVRSCG